MSGQSLSQSKTRMRKYASIDNEESEPGEVLLAYRQKWSERDNPYVLEAGPDLKLFLFHTQLI